MLLLVPAVESQPRVLARRGVVLPRAIADLDTDGGSQRGGANRASSVQGDSFQGCPSGLGGVARPDQDLLDTLESDHEHLPRHRGLGLLGYPVILVDSDGN